MTPAPKFLQRLAFPVVLFAISWLLVERGAYRPANNWLLDVRMAQTPVAPSGEIGVIAIDPKSLKNIGTWPWSRAVHAEILDTLVENGARVIMFDVDFAFAADPDGDQAFAEALDRAGGATLLATFAQTDIAGDVVYNQPHTPFAERSWPAVVVVNPDANGQIRLYPTGATIDGLFVPSAGVQLAGAFAQETEGIAINFGISPQDIPVFSVSDLLDGTLTRADIAGRSFLIGAAAAELGDHFAVPLHQVVPGVMIHAIAADTLLQGAEIAYVPATTLLPLLFVMLCALQMVRQKRALRFVGLAALTSLGVEAGALLVFQSQFVTLPTAMFHPVLIILAIGRLAQTVDLSRLLIKRKDLELLNAERLRQHIFSNSSDGFMAIDLHGQVVFQSDMAKSLLGEGLPPSGVLAAARRVIARSEAKQWLSHLEIEDDHGTKFIELHANASDFQRMDGKQNLTTEPLALVTLRDVTKIKEHQRRIEYLSQHDDQTDALRRSSFCEDLEARIAQHERFAVIAIGLRRLTAINATLGRETGDQIIAAAVRRLQAPSAGVGAVARLEGNVLGVVLPLPEGSTTPAADCARLRGLLMYPYALADRPIQIDLNMGYVISDADTVSSGEDILSRAQDALARSRTEESGAISAYDKRDGARRDRSRRMEHALHLALERGELDVVYQPQFRLSDRTLVGAEALVRWQSAEFGRVSPAEFIPIAESSGFVTQIGRFVMESAVRSAAALPSHLSISPNVTVFELLAEDFPSHVLALLERYDVAPERMCLELTESEFLSPESPAVLRMQELRAAGLSWALDDFGTGYSSLSYLKDLPFDKIKLDRSFLKDILVDPRAQNSLKSLVKLVQGYGKSLLCEGAETASEVDLLTEFGCDSVQGYYFGRPEPFYDLLERAEIEAAAHDTVRKAANFA